jgi:hypothetical protein
MPPKDPRAEVQLTNSDFNVILKRVERFLRLLTWQMFFLLAILLYLVMRPQAGRYQFAVVGDDVGVFDTSNSQAWMIKLQKKVVTPGEKPESGAPPAAGEGKQ